MGLRRAAALIFAAVLLLAPLARAAGPAPPLVLPTRPPDPPKGPNTGLPLPRFVSLATDLVNLRVGPGLQYPVKWVYHRRGLPLEVLREFDVWRLVKDPWGAKGWVHEATITGTRSFIALGGVRHLRTAAAATAPVRARLEPGVIGLILRCDAGAAWCRVKVDGRRGWLRRTSFWGSFAGEAVK